MRKRFNALWQVLAVCALFAAWPVSAQDAVRVTQTAEMLFPQYVDFSITVELPAEQIDRLQLRVSTDQGALAAVSFPQDRDFTLAAGFVVADYRLQISGENPPALFTPIRYEWRVVPLSGEVIEQGGELLYADARVEWVIAGEDDADVTVVMGQQDARAAPSVRAALLPVYELLADHTGRNPEFRFLIYPRGVAPGCERTADGSPVLRDRTPEGQETIACDLDLVQRVFERSGYRVRTYEDNQAETDQLVREMVATFYEPIWSGGDVPAWFQAGVAQFYRPRPEAGALALSRQALRRGTPFRLVEMDAPPTEAGRLNEWQAQSYGMVLYLADRAGVDAVFRLARDPLAAGSFAETYEQLAGESLALLVPAWQSWLATDDAAAAYSYAPYYPPTPTPSATPTITPTRTPLPPTPTLTPSPDVTPSVTPSRTPRPPTPTITPLPAQGFIVRSTPTPLPEPPPAVEVPLIGRLNSMQILVLGVTLLLVALLAALGLRFRGR